MEPTPLAPGAAGASESGVVPVATLTPPLAPSGGADAGPARPLPSDALTLTVSLTFDDTFLPQLDAAAILEAHALRGTFYVNSPRLYDGSANGASSLYMGVAEALALQARGHELGGHTLSHPGLTELPEAERIREIMGDRAELLALGIQARSLAYPSGDVEADPDPSLGRSVLEVARASGYSSARDTNGFSLNGCSTGAEPLPPADRFRLRSVRSVNDAPPAPAGQPAPPPDTAATLLAWLDQAARCGGGWVPLIFHHLRTDCAAPDAPGSFCFPFAELEGLSAALATGVRCPDDPAEPCYRVAVATVSDALGDTAAAPAPEVFALRNPALERTLASGNTECMQETQGTGGTGVLGRSTDVARSGVASERIQIDELVASAEVRISRDFGACAPFATEGRVYGLSLFYQAEVGPNVPVLRFMTYRLTSEYTWVLWAESDAFPAASPGEWVQGSFVTEPAPPGTLAFSFGLRQESVGVTYVDDFAGTVVGANVVPPLPDVVAPGSVAPGGVAPGGVAPGNTPPSNVPSGGASVP